MIKVYIIESERGWGSKVDSIKEFETKELAQAYIDEYNSENDKDYVPDWYMYARF
jgi:hypothetical protein